VAVAGKVPGFDGYPGSCRKGDPVTVDREKLAKTGAVLFAAGAASTPDDAARLLTSGGRVLAVSAWGPDATAARRLAYEGLSAVSFEGMAWRTDIGV
jgi:phosphoribosylamine-glycine ligase